MLFLTYLEGSFLYELRFIIVVYLKTAKHKIKKNR